MPSCCGYGRGLSRRCSKSSDSMYLCGKAMHVSRGEGKAFKQVLGTPPGGYRRNVVEVQQHTTFPGGYSERTKPEVMAGPGSWNYFRENQSTPFPTPEEKTLGQPKCSVTDSSNALIPFQAICTPIQTRKNDDNCVITVIPVAPRIRANRSANP